MAVHQHLTSDELESLSLDDDGRVRFREAPMVLPMAATAAKKKKPKPPRPNTNCATCNSTPRCGALNAVCGPTNTVPNCGGKAVR